MHTNVPSLWSSQSPPPDWHGDEAQANRSSQLGPAQPRLQMHLYAEAGSLDPCVSSGKSMQAPFCPHGIAAQASFFGCHCRPTLASGGTRNTSASTSAIKNPAMMTTAPAFADWLFAVRQKLSRPSLKIRADSKMSTRSPTSSTALKKYMLRNDLIATSFTSHTSRLQLGRLVHG